MDVIQRRVLICRLIEKAVHEPELSKQLGLENKSVFHIQNQHERNVHTKTRRRK